jgi:hypothetical protein
MLDADIAGARRRLFIEVAFRHPGDVQEIADAVRLLIEREIVSQAEAVEALRSRMSWADEDVDALLALATLEKQ